MAESLLELQDLYKEALIRDLIEKTKLVGLVWTNSGGSAASTSFSCTQIQNMPNSMPDVAWTFVVTKSQLGTLSYKYTFEAKKDGILWVTFESGALSYSSRDSLVKELYDCIELVTLQLDYKLKEAIRFIQQTADARTGPTTGYEWTSG
jgi:hypothetical protein